MNIDNMIRPGGKESDNEIFWALIFRESLTSLDIRETTVCTVQGLLIARSRISGDASEKIRLLPACTNNRFLTDLRRRGKGVECTLGDLAAGRVEAELTVAAGNIDNSRVYCRLNLKDIDFRTIIGWLEHRKNKALENKSLKSKVVSLVEYEQSSRKSANSRLKYKAALAAVRGVMLDEVPSTHVDQALKVDSLSRRKFIPVGARAVVSLRDGKGTVICSTTIAP